MEVMLTISAREANQQFSRLLETAAGGEVVTITRRGVPVAKLVPVVEKPSVDLKRERRREEILARFDQGYEGHAFTEWTRDELYDREADRRETPGCG
jgi:prevent-host-death family protein